MESEAEVNTIARHLCRDAGISWAGVFCNSMHVPARLRKALQGHLCHLAGFKPQKRRKQHSVAPLKRLKALETRTIDAAADQEAVQQLVPPTTKLLQFACTGKTSQLQQLVQQHALDVNQQCGAQGRTALHAATENGHADTCSALLQLGADSYQYDDKQVSALMLAAKHGHHAVLKVLLDAGADAFAVDDSGTNALLLAASCGSVQCIQLLLQAGFVDADYSNTDLGAGEHALLLAASGGYADCVMLLLAAGAKVNRTDKEGRTALWVASRAGHLAVVKSLLVQARLKHISHFVYGTTPIMEARAAGHTVIASLLAAHLAQHQPAAQRWELPEVPQLQQRHQQPNTDGAGNRFKQKHWQHPQLGEPLLPLQQHKAPGSLTEVQVQQQQQQQQQQHSRGSHPQQSSRAVHAHTGKQQHKQQQRQQRQQHQQFRTTGGRAACHHIPAAAVHGTAELQQQKQQAHAGGSLPTVSNSIAALLPGMALPHAACVY